MPKDDLYTRFAAVRAKPPPLTSHDMLHWDGTRVIPQNVKFLPAIQSVESPAASPTDIGCLPSSPALLVDWVTKAADLIFYLPPQLLLPAVNTVNIGVTGSLIWAYRENDDVYTIPGVYPVLLVHTTCALPQVCYTALVPHLPRHDPLLNHMALLLHAAVTAESLDERLYVKVLANALADHVLRRYASSMYCEHLRYGGLTQSKLQSAITYILEHLDAKLSLVHLAHKSHMSPAHFARLFKAATGQTPHQYVVMCRMERAKHLLTQTTLPLHEIGALVGYADQSHFTALFRQHVATTPKAYRDATSVA